MVTGEGKIMAGQIEPSAHIVILTGAGISAESGLGTFRDADGVWTKYPLADLATPEGFERNPDFVHDFYNDRRASGASAQPNAGHFALARLEAEWPGGVTLVTQNVDHLHERAGSRHVLHMHGELAKSRCNHCGRVRENHDSLSTRSICGDCGQSGGLRPHVVWFGEVPFYLSEIAERLRACQLFAAIGTSGSVYPAAGFVKEARAVGARTVELNLEPSENAWAFGETRLGVASEVVPAWVEELLAGL